MPEKTLLSTTIHLAVCTQRHTQPRMLRADLPLFSPREREEMWPCCAQLYILLYAKTAYQMPLIGPEKSGFCLVGGIRVLP